MQPLAVSGFLAKHPDLKPFIIETDGKESKWGRVVCEWREKSTGLTHLFIPLINLKTGELYLDCSRKKIYAKFVAHTFTRPLHIFAKTLYHVVFVFSIPTTLFYTIMRGYEEKLPCKQIAKHCLRNCVRSLLDCLRTPLYGVALMVISIATLVIAPFRPNTVYDMRERVGQIVESLYWHETSDYEYDLFPCFQPYYSLYEMDQGNTVHDEDTNYNFQATQYEIGLNNLARRNVYFLRDNHNVFNCPPEKLGRTAQLISPIYGEVQKVKSFV